MPGLRALVKQAPVYLTISLPLNGDCVDQNVFIADRDYTVLEVRESHAVAGNDAGAVTLDVVKATGTTAVASGTTVLASTFDMKGTADTVVSKTRANGGVVATAVAELASGNRLGFNFTGTITTLSGVLVTIVLQPRGTA